MNTYGQMERKSAELKELSRLEPVSLLIKNSSLHCVTMELDGTRQWRGFEDELLGCCQEDMKKF